MFWAICCVSNQSSRQKSLTHMSSKKIFFIKKWNGPWCSNSSGGGLYLLFYLSVSLYDGVLGFTGAESVSSWQIFTQTLNTSTADGGLTDMKYGNSQGKQLLEKRNAWNNAHGSHYVCNMWHHLKTVAWFPPWWPNQKSEILIKYSCKPFGLQLKIYAWKRTSSSFCIHVPEERLKRTAGIIMREAMHSDIDFICGFGVAENL